MDDNLRKVMMTKKQVREYLGMPKSSLNFLVMNRMIPYVKIFVNDLKGQCFFSKFRLDNEFDIEAEKERRSKMSKSDIEFEIKMESVDEVAEQETRILIKKLYLSILRTKDGEKKMKHYERVLDVESELKARQEKRLYEFFARDLEILEKEETRKEEIRKGEWQRHDRSQADGSITTEYRKRK